MAGILEVVGGYRRKGFGAAKRVTGPAHQLVTGGPLKRNTCARKEDKSLYKEIQKAIDSGKIPSHIVDSLDAVRSIGNLAARPTKDANSGEILPVEPGEAEWNIETLEFLFDFFYIQP